MNLYRWQTDKKHLCDFGVGLAAGQKADYLEFTDAQVDFIGVRH